MVKFYPDQQKGHVLVLYELRRWQIFNFQNELLPDPEKEQPHICNFPKLLLVLFLYIKASSLNDYCFKFGIYLSIISKLLFQKETRGVNGGGAGWAIAHPVFGRLEAV